MRETRKLAAILVADVVGYSRLASADEDRTLARLRGLRSDLIDPAITAHHGRIVKRTGDGNIIEFRSVVEAVRCAIEVQNGMIERNTGLPPEKRIEFRVGVHVGDVVEEGDGDLMGDGVNIAARLEQLAEPGGVVISGAASDQLQGKLEIPWEFMGEQQLKNIARPVRAYRIRLDAKPKARRLVPRQIDRRALWPVAAALVLALVLGGWFFWQRHPTPAVAGKPSLAVLPFSNIAGDEATGRLADGLTEDIITDLSRYREMDVIARNSTDAYKGKAVDVRKVGTDLNVRYVLEGSVQRDGDQIRITTQLIDAASGAQLWSERWDKPSKDFFAVQSDISDQLGNRLGGGGAIEKAEQESARRSRPEDLSAYELYLAARSEAGRATPEGVKNAIQLYEKAIKADPRLARAWVALSLARQSLMNFGGDPDSTALADAQRAVEIDPHDAAAHTALAWALGGQGNFAASEAEFDTALRLNPGDAGLLSSLASWAITFGHPERGAEAADRAIRLNPNYGVEDAWGYAYAYFHAARFEDALHILDRLPKNKYLEGSWAVRASSYVTLGKSAEAKAAVSDALAHFPDLTIEGFTGSAGMSDEERKRLIGPMRVAGFPVCAKPDTLVKNPQLARLPECISK
jgi:TolB-like protein/class 3 adenylate cyclase/Tfp pilus assembly protein PilF